MLTFRQYNDLDFFSKISVFIILHLYLAVFCFLRMLSHLGTLNEMTNLLVSYPYWFPISGCRFVLFYDKRVWVIYCSLSWQWYIFETSNLSNRTDFIMFPVANEKRRLSGAHNKVLRHDSVFIRYHWKLIKLRHTNVLYMLLNVS